jgi:hypothetical protein
VRAGRLGEGLAAAAVLAALAALALHFDARPRHEALAAIPDTARALAAAIALFGVTGFALVRLLLPAALKRHELLWVLPAGACATGLTLTMLGFAAVPYAAALPLVGAAGLTSGWLAVRRRGWPAVELRALAWPLYIAAVVLAVALIPMVCMQHFAAPVGEGSDAHMATGVAQLLKHDYPTATDLSQPIQQMWPQWQSKYPIYYALAAVSTVSGLATWQVLAVLAALLLALAALGMFLVARELLRAPPAVSLAAMGFAALDRMALGTVIHPYFNQTWGFFATPFTLVLGWWVVQPGLTRRAREATLVLLVLFGLVLALAYPLATPIPAVPLVVFAWRERRRALAVRRLYRGARSLVWMVPAAALLAVPVAGAVDKGVHAGQVLLPGHNLQAWGGDMLGFIAWNSFFSLPSSAVGFALFALVLALAAGGLAAQPRSLSWGLGGLVALGLLFAVYFRHRAYGWYFEFKLLAFIGPLTLLIAAIGAGRLRRWGALLLAGLSVTLLAGVIEQIKANGFQLDQSTIQLADWARSLPPRASVRLDMWPPQQLWAAYFLAGHPLCSQLPLLGTDYPHVAIGRKADYIIASLQSGRPRDALGPALRQNAGYRLFRQNPATPAAGACTLRQFDRLYSGFGHSPW